MGSENKDNELEKIRISLPRVPEYHLAIFTGQYLEITQTIDVPVIDAHMHIQSNNIAPCTLQWGMIRSLLASALANDPDMLDQTLKQVDSYAGIVKWGSIPLWIFSQFIIPGPPRVRMGSLSSACGR